MRTYCVAQGGLPGGNSKESARNAVAQVPSLSQEETLKEKVATPSSVLAQIIP